MLPKTLSASYFRSFIFGVEDSLVSTVGLLAGVAIANVDRKTIFLTGLILIFVEAFSMAAGSFISEQSVEELVHKNKVPVRRSIYAGSIMFLSYFVSGFIPLAPYIFMSVENGLRWSIAFSLLALFILGILGAKATSRNPIESGLRMFLVGGLAIGVGIFVGSLIK